MGVVLDVRSTTRQWNMEWKLCSGFRVSIIGNQMETNMEDTLALDH